MQSARKLINLADLKSWRAALKAKLVVTNGCFDILHLGHVSYLERARAFGDALLIGVNSDSAVKALKGPTRPINPEHDRALLIAALECVDYVCIFPEPRATTFLTLARPDIYVKGGDYTLETLDQSEREAVQAFGAHIEILPFLPGKSTTGVIAKMNC